MKPDAKDQNCDHASEIKHRSRVAQIAFAGKYLPHRGLDIMLVDELDLNSKLTKFLVHD